MLQLLKEPLIYLCHFVNLVHVIYLAFQGFGYNEDAFICRCFQCALYVVYLKFLVLHEAMHPLSYHAQALLDSFFKVTTYGHDLSHGLH